MASTLARGVALAGVILGAVFAPVALAPGVSFYSDVTPKVAVFWVGAALLCLAPEAWTPGVKRLWEDRLGRWFLALCGVQVLSLTLSTALSQDPELSFIGSNWRRFGWATEVPLTLFTVMLAGWLAADPRRLRTLVAALCAGGAAAALYGIAQYAGYDPWLPRELYHVGEGARRIVRPPGPLGHAGYFATYLLSVVFLGGRLLRPSSAYGWIAVGLAIVAIVLSGTRGALAGLAVGAGVLLLSLKPTLDRRSLGAAVLVAALAAGFYFSPAGERLRARALWSSEDVWGGTRPWLWRDTARMSFDAGLFGSGLETFSFVFPRHASEELARRQPDTYYESPHNLFLDAAAGQGWSGLMILAGLCAVGLLAALRDRRKEVAWGAAALAASLASNQFLALTLPTAILLYATIAAVVGARAWATTGDAGGTSKGLRAAAAIVAAAMLWGACSLTVADRRLEAVRERLQAKDFDGASQRYREFMAIRPAGMTADLWYAYNTRDRGAAERATLAAEDRQNAWMLLAQIAAEQGDAVTVEAALREAIDAAPNWYKPRWTLGRLLRQGGREEQAVEQLRRAAELAGGFYPELETEARR